jgi:integrase/recombinase XerD
MNGQSGWEAPDAEAVTERPDEASPDGTRLPALWRAGAGNPRVDLAITAWLHAKFQRSGSAKTRTAYATILAEFRAALEMEGLDLDAADPRRCREDLALIAATTPTDFGQATTPTDSGAIEDLMAARATALALVAQAFAARPAETRYGPRPVAPTTANLRLAALSSFYTYASRQDLIRGSNPISRVERRRVEAYAAARPLAYDDLRERLAAIDIAEKSGLRDYALLLVALHTGRRVAELAAMRREHLRIHNRSVEITWPRCKGGKTMRDELPRGGARGEAADALVAWVTRLYEDGVQSTGDRAARAIVPRVVPQPGRSPEQPLWVSMSRNGTAGHALTVQAISQMCEKRLGTSKFHALRHTFARAMEDAGAKVSEIQAALGHADLGTTGRYLARLHQGENRHLARLSGLYGLSGLDQRMHYDGTSSASEASPEPDTDSTPPRESRHGSPSS